VRLQVDLGAKLNSSRVVESIRSRSAGYYCDVCDVLCKDSINYLDHINGKNHQRNLGLSMRVERSTVESVTERLARLKQQKVRGTAACCFKPLRCTPLLPLIGRTGSVALPAGGASQRCQGRLRP
jgi:hypothetical protein